MRVAIIGAGNGGQALAAWMASKGHSISLFDRNMDKVRRLQAKGIIELSGAINLKAPIDYVSNNLLNVIKGSELIMVATTATAHRDIAGHIAASLEKGQIIILNPGRTGGALEFRNKLIESGLKNKVYISEAQTLVFACRLIEDGKVNIIGVKEKVLLSAIPSTDTLRVLEALHKSFSCFYPARNVLETSFENIGSIFHPCVTLFNEAAIERGSRFYFYRDMTEGLARLIEEADRERLAVAKAYGYMPISAKDWISYAYGGVKGDSLCERMQNNPAYFDILAPTSIECRQITEDIPTGILPLHELGEAAGVSTPLFNSLITICSILLKTDFRREGRNLKNLGLANLSKSEILKLVEEEC